MNFKKLYTVIRTNENGAGTKTLFVVLASATVLVVGLAATSKSAQKPVVLVIEEVVDTITEA